PRPLRPAALALLLAACTGAAPDCSGLPGRPMLVATLFMGREVPGRPPVARPEWDAFADDVVARRFPDGFTLLEGSGRWRDPATGRVAAEDSFVLLIAAPPGPATRAGLEAVAAAYRERFRQKSVGLITTPACGTF
ncbi:MAG TPA: DUF3574 domain-containing protein, partial [Crenalkalicoccus sp.]|nr:DUF3574 domain-containing protein [Crenalkalicoccus sp.]